MSLIRSGILLAAASLASCYVQVEDERVQLTHAFCNPSTSDCIPGGGVQLKIISASVVGDNTFTIPFGDLPLLKSTDALGPTTLHTTLKLASASLAMKTANADFKGIDSMQLLKAPRASNGPTDDPCAGTATCPVIAAYTKATDGTADQQILLRSEVANLLDLIDPVSHNLIIEVRAAGVAPQPPLWNADLTLDLSMKSKVNYP